MAFRFEKVIEAAAAQFLGDLGRQALGSDVEQAQAAHVVARVREHLLGRWRHAQRTQIRCSVRFRHANGTIVGCASPMIARCVCCEQPTCASHGMIGLHDGDAVCLGCVEGMRAALYAGAWRPPRAGSPPPGSGSPPPPRSGSTAPSDAKLRRKYLRRLKLRGRPSEKEILAAFRREAAAAHPDRVVESQKDKAHKRFVALGEARDWLLADLERRAAA